MAGYIRSKGQVLNRSQIRESLQRQRMNPTDHQRRRADTVRVRNPIHIMQHIMDINYTVIKTKSFLDMAAHYLLSSFHHAWMQFQNSSNVLHA